MTNLVALARFFVAVSAKEDVGQVVADSELLNGVLTKYAPSGKPIDWAGLANSDDFVPTIQAITRSGLILNQLVANADQLSNLRTLVASLGS